MKYIVKNYSDRIFWHVSVLFLLAIVLSVLLRYTDSDYPFGIFKLFFIRYTQSRKIGKPYNFKILRGKQPKQDSQKILLKNKEKVLLLCFDQLKDFQLKILIQNVLHYKISRNRKMLILKRYYFYWKVFFKIHSLVQSKDVYIYIVNVIYIHL